MRLVKRLLLGVRPALPTWSRRRWAALTALWIGAVALGVAAALVTGYVIGPLVDEALLIAGTAFGWLYVSMIALWVCLPAIALLARSAPARFAASGLLIGFAGLVRAATIGRTVGCTFDFPGYCIPNADALWTWTTLAALVVGALLPVLAIRKETSPLDLSLVPRDGPVSVRSGGHRAAGLQSGPQLISELERTLGVAVVVHTIDRTAPVTVHALLTFGSHSREVTAIGPSEPDAWRALARMAVEWRNANEVLVPLWGGGA